MPRILQIVLLILVSSALMFAQGTSIATAVAVSPNGSVGGSMSNTFIDHFWKATTISNGYLRVQINSDAGIEVDVTLFDVNGTSSMTFDGRTSTYSEVYGFLKPGTYYVQAHRWTGTTGSYTMTTSFTAPPRTTALEPNDTWSTAPALSPMGTATGNVGYYGNGNADLDD